MSRILIEAEQFDNYGGWSLDSQFESEMGSPYLLAHGLGKPVADALTKIEVPSEGAYDVWVRVKDWVPKYHPGRYELHIGGRKVAELGVSGAEGWNWENAGSVQLAAGETEIALHDLTGFEGRCDAIYLTTEGDVPLEKDSLVDRSWRKKLLGIPESPAAGKEYDVVIVGAGVPGCAAALSAAKTGSKVALITDRLVLGGNASTEIGLGPRGYMGKFVMDMCKRQSNGELKAVSMVYEEENISVYTGERVYDVVKKGDEIEAILIRNLRTGIETCIKARVFIDASGKAAVAIPAGAEIRTGREGRDEYHESLAPASGDNRHHGHTVLYHLHYAAAPVEFPEVPWATEVSRDFGDLNGQLSEIGSDNHYGPDSKGRPRRMKKAKQMANLPWLGLSTLKSHKFPEVSIIDFFPGTHFWEYGQDLDLYTNGEEIRDHLLRALYGTMYNVKKAQPEKYANLEFEWIHFVPASGEFCRIMGDYIVNENEIREHKQFPDSIVQQDGAICVHNMENPKYDFRLTSWTWDVRDLKPYWLPFRSLYSKDVPNLLMAGKQISVTRVVGCNTKLMANGAEHGVAAGCAASLCVKENITPRMIYQQRMNELRKMVAQFEWEDQKSHQSVMMFFS